MKKWIKKRIKLMLTFNPEFKRAEKLRKRAEKLRKKQPGAAFEYIESEIQELETGNHYFRDSEFDIYESRVYHECNICKGKNKICIEYYFFSYKRVCFDCIKKLFRQMYIDVLNDYKKQKLVYESKIGGVINE